MLGVKGQTVIRLEQRGYLTDVSGRAGPHHHYYAQTQVRTLQRAYAPGITDPTLRGRLAANATGAPSAHKDRPSREYSHVWSETAAWLTAYLTAQGGTARVSELLRDAQTAGHSQAACYSARNHAGIFSVAVRGPGMGSVRGWRLPAGSPAPAHDAVLHDDVQVEHSVRTSDSSRLLRPADLTRIFSLSPTTLWRLEQTPGFPKKYRLSDNAVGFRENEIQAWLEARRGVGVTGPLKGGRPRTEPQRADAVQPVDIPPPAVIPSSEQHQHDGIMSHLQQIHAKLDRLLSLWQ